MHKDVIAQIGRTLGAAEKQAGLGNIGRGLVNIGARMGSGLNRGAAASLRFVAPTLSRAFTRPVYGMGPMAQGAKTLPIAGYRMSMPRTLATTGTIGLGTLEAQNLWSQAQQTPESRFVNAQEQYKDMLGGIQNKLSARTGYESSPEYNAWHNRLGRAAGLGGETSESIRQRMLSGQFGGSTLPSFGGLNPWYKPNAAGQIHNAQQATQGMVSEYQRATQPHGNRGAIQNQLHDLHERLGLTALPEQRKMIQEEMGRLSDHLNTPSGQESPYARYLRQRMRAMGVNDPLANMTPAASSSTDVPSSGYATLAADPWHDEKIRQYALDPNDRGLPTARVRPIF